MEFNDKKPEGHEQFKLKILSIFDIIKRITPMKFERVISNCVFETGYSEKKIHEILKHLYNLEKINIENDIVSIPGEKK